MRIGDTVRRPLRPFSLTVQAYLAHLRDAGFTGAPLPFGVDEQGREMLSYVPGDVPPDLSLYTTTVVWRNFHQDVPPTGALPNPGPGV